MLDELAAEMAGILKIATVNAMSEQDLAAGTTSAAFRPSTSIAAAAK